MLINAITWRVTLVDFYFADDIKYKQKNYWGCKTMMPPEMILEEGTDTEACDLFALAKIFFILYTGVEPFKKAHPQMDRDYFYLANRDYSIFWDRIGQRMTSENPLTVDFKQFMQASLSRDPSERPQIPSEVL